MVPGIAEAHTACFRRLHRGKARTAVEGCSALQGFAYVRFNNPISAASAVERYNGFELPAGSGLRLKVSRMKWKSGSCLAQNRRGAGRHMRGPAACQILQWLAA